MFRRRRPETSENAFDGLRQNLISASATSLAIEPSDRFPNVWAVLMELGMAGGVASIVCLADGTTSMYTSTGGGMIGAGQHESVKAASLAFLDEAERSLALLEPVEFLPLPDQNTVRFNVLTFSGARTAVGIPDELARGGLPLSALFVAGDGVITQLRMV